MNQSSNSHSSARNKLVIKITGIILLALLAWAAFNGLVNTIAKSSNAKRSSSAMIGQDCVSPGEYRKRVEQAFSAFGLARQALIKEIKMAKYMSYPSASVEYGDLNKVDMATAKREDEFSRLVSVNGTYKQNLSCHQGKDAADVKLYLYALTNLDMADNLLFQARGEISATCNPEVSAYKPYLAAADQAVEMAKQDISGKIKPQDPTGYLAKMPDERLIIKTIQDLCH